MSDNAGIEWTAMTAPANLRKGESLVCAEPASRGLELRVYARGYRQATESGRLLPNEPGWFFTTGSTSGTSEPCNVALRQCGFVDKRSNSRRGIASWNYPAHITRSDAEVLAQLGWVKPAEFAKALRAIVHPAGQPRTPGRDDRSRQARRGVRR